MKNRIELEKLGLSYYDIGINKKIHTLINENVKCYITYKKIEVEKTLSINKRRYNGHHLREKLLDEREEDKNIINNIMNKENENE